MRHRWLGVWLIVAFALAGCGDSGTDTDADSADAEADAPETEATGEDAADVEDGASETDGADAPPLTGISLPQAIAGALWADPDVYDEVPLHVAVEGGADEVTVQLGTAAPVAAADPEGDGDWIALLSIAGLADGVVELTATAVQSGAAPQTATAELGLGRAGVQLTDFSIVGMAGVPRVHRVGAEAWLTWTDRSDGDAEAWLRKIDGAARWTTDKVRLVDEPGETLYARTAVGDAAIGLLYQEPGSPYATHFKVDAFDGTELVAPIELETTGWSGAFSGDVVWDGAGFVAAWRVYSDAGTSEVRWLRVAGGTWAVTGPVVVATSGPATTADPNGGFQPFSFIDVAAIGDLSLVGFVRGRYEEVLDMEIPKSQLALLHRDGTIEYGTYAGIINELRYHRECRVFGLDGAFTAVWSDVNLTDPADNPPNLFYAARTDAAGALDPLRGTGIRMFDAVDDRDEPFLIGHPVTRGVLAWTDNRSYTLDPAHGQIELYVAPVDETWQTGAETVFPHARFFAGLAGLTGANAGTNVLLVWIDQRHSGGILDPHPELYFETAWY
jgi:hypothetical protein